MSDIPTSKAQTMPDILTQIEHDARYKALRLPFPKAQIGKLPATPKRPALDFVGHAAVTDRLNKVLQGDWHYTVDELFTQGQAVWIRGTFTVDGTSRVEYGDGADPKEAIGNFIRRGAMRFGVAIDLWSREELERPTGTAETISPDVSRQSPPSTATPVAGGGDMGSPPSSPSPTSSPQTPVRGDGSAEGGTHNGEGATRPPSDPQALEGGPDAGTGPPSDISRRDRLWMQLLDYTKTKKKAVNEVNKACKAGFREDQHFLITEDELETTLRKLLQEIP